MRKGLNALLTSIALAGQYSPTMPYPIDYGTPPDVFGRNYRKNQRKSRKEKRQNPHRYK